MRRPVLRFLFCISLLSLATALFFSCRDVVTVQYIAALDLPASVGFVRSVAFLLGAGLVLVGDLIFCWKECIMYRAPFKWVYQAYRRRQRYRSKSVSVDELSLKHSLSFQGEESDSSVTPANENIATSNLTKQALPGKLAVITCYFNPCGWEIRKTNYLRFLGEMGLWSVDLFSAEVAFGEQEFPTRDAFIQIRANDRHALWQKERLLNLIVERLPAGYDKVAWIDADLTFLNPLWASQANKALQRFPVIQLFSEVLWLNATGQIGGLIHQGGPGGCGFAWASRRDVFPLYDKMIVGGGDIACLDAWTDRRGMVTKNCLTTPLREDYERWAQDAYRKVRGSVGAIPGQCIHHFHGSIESRAYSTRWQVIRNAELDPSRDLRLDLKTGLLALSESDNPLLAQELRGYFFSRKEDDLQKDREERPFVPTSEFLVSG